VRVRQPFDFVALGPNGVDIFFDAKRSQGTKSVCRSLFTGESTAHQQVALSEVAQFGRRAGFVVMLDALNQVFWVPVCSGKPKILEAVSWGPLSNLEVRFENTY
jgi:hypothetical protein